MLPFVWRRRKKRFVEKEREGSYVTGVEWCRVVRPLINRRKKAKTIATRRLATKTMLAKHQEHQAEDPYEEDG